MPPDLSSDFKELVRTRTDLVSLVGESISLTPRRGGREYVGLCPFHEDHNPSLVVYPDRQSFRCWSCNEGGDCFSWIMKADAVEFREALETLARRAHLELPKTFQRGTGQQDKNALHDVLKWAEGELHRCLLESAGAAGARDYLEERGFQRETIDRFRIGYHPNDWQWLQHRKPDRFTAKHLLAARLIGEHERTAGHYDFFVDRVMFPIRDRSGRPVAFGARVLPGNSDSDAPKYWNSPESSVFTKSRLLYGLDVAREGIRKSQTAVVVEGYTDCITAHQYGLSNVVGTLGTALTETHVLGIKRFARKVVLVYDGDAPGQNAAERSLAKFLAQDVDLRILTLPNGSDPADFLADHGVEAFRKLIETAAEAWEHKFRLTIDRFGTESIDARQRVLDEMLDLVGEAPRLSGTIREGIILGKLSQRLGLAEQVVRKRLLETRKQKASRRPTGGANATRTDPAHLSQRKQLINADWTKHDLAECDILEIIFAEPAIVEKIRLKVSVDDFHNGALRGLLDVCYRCHDHDIVPSYERVMAALEDPDLKRLAVWIDEQARAKQIANKLHDDQAQKDQDQEIAEPTKKPYLVQAIERLKWRREEELHEQTKGQLAQHTETSTALDPGDKALLRQATGYHQKRVTKKTLT